MGKPYRILSCDGGGIRGLLTLQILKRLIEVRPNLLEEVDLFAGTSTGGLIALGLASKFSVDQLERLYLENAKEIFRDTAWDDVKDLGRLVGAEYSLDALAAVCRDSFGESVLGDLERRVLIGTFDLDDASVEPRRWKPKFFHNLGGSDSDDAFSVADVALATCAAPTYFPAHKGYVDGGVVAGNPTMAAVAQALDDRVPLSHRAESLGDIRLLSLGTGVVPQRIDGSPDWGELQWIKPLVELMLEGSVSVPDFQARALLGRARYRRVNPDLPVTPRVPLDGIEHMPLLVELGRATPLGDLRNWLENGWTLG